MPFSRPYPLIFAPLLHARVWGGRTLARFGKALPDNGPIGESWEIADLPADIERGRSVIANGPWSGRTLREVIGQDRASLIGDATLSDDGGFPLLIKLLDARANLSVQVHPTIEYVREHAGTHLKTEAWIVLEAEPDAMIYRDLVPGVSRSEFERHVREGTVAEALNAVPARPGDCHYLPAGTCHALGAGVFVAEVQTPSDTTFRLYDWGRLGRQLHVEQALACMTFGAGPAEAEPPAVPIERGGLRTETLLDCDWFTIERLTATADVEIPLVTDGLPVAWITLSGRATFAGGGETVHLTPGATTLLPAALEDGVARLSSGFSALRTHPPHPARNMLAR